MRLFVTAILASTLVLGAVTDDDGVGGLDVIAGVDPNGVIVDGTHNTPGHPGDPGTSPIGDSDPGTDSDWTPPPGWAPPPEFNFAQCLNDWDSYIQCFRAQEEEAEETPAEEAAAPAIPAVTIADVARFAPAGSAISAEPDNVGVVGLPTNFVAAASVHTVNDSLFGFPVAVRFTPVGYDFTFGDGTTTTTAEGGRSWADLGQAQFTPTPTSHTYAERGTYSAAVDVRYTAEVDFGIGWFPIPGEVTSSGAAQEVRIFEAHTALVAHTCEQAPDSPGC
ncbi:hypothetical protein ACNPNP_10150 [Microbacterium sp. AGC85]